jgi:hypothetical protein
MTRPKGSNDDDVRASASDRRQSRWLVPLLPGVLGAVDLVASAMGGHILSGVGSLAVLSTIGVLSPVAARFEAARRWHHDEDKREAIINTRAMSATGTILVIAITGCATFTLARGESTGPYTALLAVGGLSNTIASLALRHGRS